MENTSFCVEPRKLCRIVVDTTRVFAEFKLGLQRELNWGTMTYGNRVLTVFLASKRNPFLPTIRRGFIMTLSNFFSKLLPQRRRTQARNDRRKRFSPRFENLEERRLMAFAAFTGDYDGSVYAQDRTGELRWYKDTLRDGTDGFTGANQGNVIDTDWDNYKSVFSGGDGILYAIDNSGKLRWYRDTLRDGTPASGGSSPSFGAPNEGNIIGTGWGNFTKVFSGGDGVIYAIDATGGLRWYDDVARDGSGIVAGFPTSFPGPNQGALIGTGWNAFTDVFSTADGNIYAVQPSGAMLWYKDLARNGTMNFHAQSGTQVNTGFVNYELFGGGTAPTGQRVVYGAHQPDGNLYLFKVNEAVAPAQFLNAGNGTQVNGGWINTYLEGYSGLQSVMAGQPLQFYVGATEPYNVQFERLHAQFDASGMPIPGDVGTVISIDPNLHAAKPRTVPVDAYKGAGWDIGNFGQTIAGDFALPNSIGWQSGIYAAHITNGLFDTYIPFVVRPTPNGRHNPHAVIVNTNTWNAYNGWGGHSAYDLGSELYGPSPIELGTAPLSFRRPNPSADPTKYGHLLQGELWVNSWLEDQGYALDYYTDQDLHNGVNGLDHLNPGTSRYDTLIISTHPEYYSIQEKANLEAYVDGDLVSGGSVLYLGGNGVFQAVHYDDADPSKMHVRYFGRTRRENWFRHMSGQQSERGILGVASQWDPEPETEKTGAYKITNAALAHPFFYSTLIFADPEGDLVVGEHAGPSGFKASGWETDQATSPAPGIPLVPDSRTFLGYGGDPNPHPDVEVLGHGKIVIEDAITHQFYDEGSDMTVYNTHPARGINGGFVFSVGSITFGGSLLVDPNLKIIVQNAMDMASKINAPVVNVMGPTTYTENAAPLLFASTSTISDQNSPNFMGGRLQIRIIGGIGSTDRLAIRNVGLGPNQIGLSGNDVTYGGIIIGRWSGGTAGVPLTVNLNAEANVTNTRVLLRNVTFEATGENPLAGPRDLVCSLSDGDGLISSNPESSRRIHVGAVNDIPVVNTFGADVTYTENGLGVQLSPTGAVSDVDSPNFDLGGLTVRFVDKGHANDRLTIRNQGNITTNLAGEVLFAGVAMGTMSGGLGLTPLVVNFNNQANAGKALQLLRAVYYSNVSENPTTAVRTVSAQVSDGDGGTSLAVTKLINVVAVNDRPTLGGISGSVSYTNLGAAVSVATTATLTDVDSANLNTGKLTIRATTTAHSSNVIELGGTLFTIDASRNVIRHDAVNGDKIIGVLNLNGGIGLTKFEVTFNANATPFYVQQLIRAVRFRTTSNTNTSDRVLSFSVTDDLGAVSDVLTKTIDLP
jgi:Tachylectin